MNISLLIDVRQKKKGVHFIICIYKLVAMKSICFVLVLLILSSCGTNNFAKRKYTKGVYVEKRTSASNNRKKVDVKEYHVSKEQIDRRIELVDQQNEIIENETSPVHNSSYTNESNIEENRDDPEKITSVKTNKINLADKSNSEIAETNPPKDPIPAEKSNSSMILGIVSILTMLLLGITFYIAVHGVVGMVFAIIAVILAIVAIILGAKSLKKEKSPQRKKAIAGIVLGSITLIAGVFILIIMGVFVGYFF